jgi:triosephosphate isomerase
MRQKVAAANWKMNLNQTEALQLSREVLNHLHSSKKKCQVILAPSFPFISAVSELINGTHGMSVAAQDCSAHSQGAYTGEVSARQIQSAGAAYVLIGHSERRTYHQEQSELLNLKIQQALTHRLKIIFCCGETLEQRNRRQHFATVKQQLEETLFKLDGNDLLNVIIAYEPVWAIGTGVNATAAEAQEMHRFIRTELNQRFGEVADRLSILYGGSCNEKNAAELFAQPDIDGGLIGGASLKAESFLAIIQALG